MFNRRSFLFVCMVCMVLSCSLVSAGSTYRLSDHYDGKRFYNQVREAEQGFKEFIRWVMNRKRGPWKEWTAAEPGPAPPKSVDSGAVRITLINHATLLIQMDGVNILTDPIWSDRASPVSFAGPKRVCPPGIRFEDLPPIHVVAVSHNHYDHMDIPTLKRLADIHAPRVMVPLGNRTVLQKHGIMPVRELDWWQQENLSDRVRIVCVPAQHFSSRGLFDHNKALWSGFVFEGDSGTVYFAGDTGFGPHFAQIAERFPEITAALLPIGAFQPEWFMNPGHISPEDALKAHTILGAYMSIGMHYGTFPLGDDGQYEAVERLKSVAADGTMYSDGFKILDFGQGMSIMSINKSLVNVNFYR